MSVLQASVAKENRPTNVAVNVAAAAAVAAAPMVLQAHAKVSAAGGASSTKAAPTGTPYCLFKDMCCSAASTLVHAAGAC